MFRVSLAAVANSGRASADRPAQTESAPCRRQGRVIAQSRGVGDLIYELQARFRPESHAVSDRSIEIDHRRGHDGSQPVVERRDAGPVGIAPD